ncbi:MAG: ankyrin repeat domain-containing protein, partial [Proteobacteria bacterium]|nr:ankyrin repeat domain-containing protein [Pseudomonadota bacterium]
MSDPIPIQAIPLINSYNKRSNSITGTSGGGGGGNANSALFDAATGGDLNGVQRALNGGADIFYRRSNQCAYNIVCEKMNRYQIEYQNVNPYTSRYNELQQIIGNYNEILRTIQAHGKERLSEAINESNASLFQACHQASGVLNKELLYEACSKSDNVEIVAYMIQDSSNVWWTETIYPTSTLSPYRTARRNKRKQVAAYLKYTLSIKCTQAVKENATALVKSLLEAGASPDLRDTDNVRVALEHKNVEMMQYLCQHGAKIPNEWKGQTLKSMPSDMVDVIEKCLLNRQLRLCAARGDLSRVIRCH